MQLFVVFSCLYIHSVYMYTVWCPFQQLSSHFLDLLICVQRPGNQKASNHVYRSLSWPHLPLNNPFKTFQAVMFTDRNAAKVTTSSVEVTIICFTGHKLVHSRCHSNGKVASGRVSGLKISAKSRISMPRNIYNIITQQRKFKLPELL